jgi:radical SAM superfamily enzyme YgiQ (UPF0313 family)
VTLSKHSRNIVLVAMYPGAWVHKAGFYNYGARRIQASLSEHHSVEIIDLVDESEAEACANRLLSLAPDIIGFSTYLWSLPTFVQLARKLRDLLPNTTFIFGGPAAHPNIFKLEPYRDAHQFIDALILGEGEATFRDVADLPALDAETLRLVPGLALPNPLATVDKGCFSATAEREPEPILDKITSPYQQGIMPKGGVAYLQTYVGCPLACTYCEWGALKNPKRVFSSEYLTRELESFHRSEAQGALLVDAALNLNSHAFENLRIAEEQVRFFKTSTLICELYPSMLTDVHMRFLENVGNPQGQIGLQSFDPEVLKRLERPFDELRFERVLRELAQVAGVTVEIIFALPGDNRDSFRKTFARLRELPCRIRIYHCVVLPSALMSRAPKEFALHFDPYTLKIESCLGWSAAEVEEESSYLNALAEQEGMGASAYWWDFEGALPPKKGQRKPHALSDNVPHANH